MMDNQNEPKISVILPIYNQEKYLDKCLKSICYQNYENLEIILVDDGSNDNSSLICDHWVKLDSRIKVIHKSNGGVSSARNAGLAIASGDYISFVDPDDYLEPNLYSKLKKYYFVYDMIGFGFFCDKTELGHPNKIEGCTILTTVSNHKEMISQNYPKMLGFSVDDIIRWNRGEELYSNRAGCYIWQFLIRTQIIKDHHLQFNEELIYQEDDIFLMRCLIYTSNLIIENQPFYNYFEHKKNISHQINNDQIIEKSFYY